MEAKLLMLRSMWAAPADWDELFAQTRRAGFDGIEGPIPADAAERRAFRARLDDHGFAFLAEATTGLRPGGPDDWWVPHPDASLDDHLEDLRFTVAHASELGAVCVSTMCGVDAWSFEQNLEFFERGLALEREYDVPIAFETHRCRSLYNPWITRDLLKALPEMKLNCDFSHWCVVAERLLSSESEIFELAAERALHVQCRVGHPQGAQVADPRDPRVAHCVEAHERWWDLCWDAQLRQGRDTLTMTAEWGDEGYLQTLPYTGQPVVDLWEVTCWMAERQRARFAGRAAL